MEDNKPKTYEECSDIIDGVIKKYKNRWQLKALNWLDFNDVEQLVRIHINEKWRLWDQSKPLEPWVATVTLNRMRNLIRNHYGNYASPCVRCQFNMGGGVCSWTRSGYQESTCPDYSKWSEFKKDGYGIKVPVPLENHQIEVDARHDSGMDFDEPIERLNFFMKKDLSELHYKAYIMLFFENKSEEEVSKFMGYKSNEKNRSAGYKQIKNIKKMLKAKAKELMDEHDIIVK